MPIPKKLRGILEELNREEKTMPQNEYNIPPKGLILKFENSTFARHEALSAALAFAELAGVSVIPVDVSTDLGGEIAN
ncbi:hypothetical protein FACS1894188_12680 [Clostridia bacterium]|nr:hypothetical protein FACS1894188_12680 [Clostridia bacterium]